MDVCIRKARVTDVKAIFELITCFSKKEVMLPVSLGDLTERLRDFFVAEIDGAVAGAVAIHVTWEDLVEIRSLAVSESAQGKGFGHKLMQAALDDAAILGARKVFALTYVPKFFEHYGFQQVDRSTLPHKVWQDCIKCQKFPDCGEIAMIREME